MIFLFPRWDMLVSWRVLSPKSVRLHQIYLKHHKYHQLLIKRIPDEHATNQWHLSAPKKISHSFFGPQNDGIEELTPLKLKRRAQKNMFEKKIAIWWSFLSGRCEIDKLFSNGFSSQFMSGGVEKLESCKEWDTWCYCILLGVYDTETLLLMFEEL